MLTIEKTHSGWIICKDDHPKSVRTMCISWDELLELHDLLGYEIQENEQVQKDMRILHAKIERYDPNHAERLTRRNMLPQCKIIDFKKAKERIENERATRNRFSD